MPNDINKLRRLMRRANYIKNNHPSPVDLSFALSKAWWFESLRDALNNGMARIEYRKIDGSVRRALATRSPILIPADKMPKTEIADLGSKDMENAKAIPYFDLDKNEWRSFNVLLFDEILQSWSFNNNNNPKD